MTLFNLLAARIRADGPISLADYMAECLMHPKFGYYATRDPFGVAGDFITAPEISQMFGELIGLSLAKSWMDQGRPSRVTLAELGPGRGTLMNDLLRATGRVPGFHDAIRIHLVETSPTLRAVQAERLSDHDPVWRDSVADLPEEPLYLIANEFFDALPIRQFQRAGALWRERHVGLADNRLILGLGPAMSQPALDHRLEDTAEGDLVELCPSAAPIAEAIGRRIADHGGTAIVVDYGDWRSLGDTFQALSEHQSIDPLANPGSADLTAHVDFEAIARAAPCAHTSLTPQGVFLERLGITDRARALASKADATAMESIVSAHRRLTHPEEMGNLFHVIGLYPANVSPPPGLDP